MAKVNIRPKNKSIKGIDLTTYKSQVNNKVYKTVEINVSKHISLTPTKLRMLARWFNAVADWMEAK